MKCDLHVHTIHSGMCTVPLLDRFCRESYNEPAAVYETLKGRGMDLVTITDHDSIDAAEELRRHHDFFLSEEVSCTTPGGTRLHMGVFDISERQHMELQRLRDDLPALIAYLNAQQLFFAINHVFSSLTGPRTHSDFALFENHFPGIETRNGQMLASSNRAASALAARWGKAPIAGSDAHTLRSLGLTYTDVPGARTREEFLIGLRRRAAVVHGDSGRYGSLTLAVLEIGCAMLRARPWAAPLTPLLAAIPLITFANTAAEYAFVQRWTRRLRLEPFPYERLECPVELIGA